MNCPAIANQGREKSSAKRKHGRQREKRSPWTALRNKHFVLVTLLHGVLSLHFDVLSVAIPLWIAHELHVPLWIVSVLMVVNTTIVVLFQVPASRGAIYVAGAASLGRRAGFGLGVACLLFALSDVSGATALTVVLLVCGVIVLTIAELWLSASAFALSFDLADQRAHGQHQAVFALGRGAAKAVAPVLLAVVCVSWDFPGWLALGTLFAVAGSLLVLVVRRSPRPQVERKGMSVVAD